MQGADRTFTQRSSIIRRLTVLMAALALFFLLDFSGTWLSSHFFVKGLQRIHESNQVLDLSTRAIDGASASVDTLARVLTGSPIADVVDIFDANQRQALADVDRASGMSEAPDPKRDLLLKAARDSLQEMSRAARPFFGRVSRAGGPRDLDEARGDLVVIQQLGQDARDDLRKVQIEVRKRSDADFESIYSNRHRPTLVALFLAAVFSGFLLLVGFPLIRRLTSSMEALLAATDAVSRGDLGFQAKVITSDEVGRVTSEFNRMVASLSDTMAKEHAARSAAEKDQRRLAFLASSANAFSESLDSEAILKEIARIAVPFLADGCAVDVVLEDGRIRRAASAPADLSQAARRREFEAFASATVDSPGIVAEVIRTGRSVVISGASGAAATGGPGPAAPDAPATTPMLFVSLQSRGASLGALSLFQASPARQFQEDDLPIVEDFARRAATALENATLYRKSQEAIAARDEFLSIASHELRTPLTPLRMQLHTLERATEASGQMPIERLKKLLRTASRMVDRLTNLVNELLDVSRINAGRFSYAFADTDLAEVATEIVERYHDELARAGTPVRIVTQGPVIGHWDRARIEQVVTNLLTNAMRYARGKTISVEIRADDQVARLIVRDQGIGIAPEDQARIFERFERASPSSHYGGLGLGLYIVRQILDAHHGRITVSSSPGQGATFVVELPLGHGKSRAVA